MISNVYTDLKKLLKDLENPFVKTIICSDSELFFLFSEISIGVNQISDKIEQFYFRSSNLTGNDLIIPCRSWNKEFSQDPSIETFSLLETVNLKKPFMICEGAELYEREIKENMEGSDRLLKINAISGSNLYILSRELGKDRLIDLLETREHLQVNSFLEAEIICKSIRNVC